MKRRDIAGAVLIAAVMFSMGVLATRAGLFGGLPPEGNALRAGKGEYAYINPLLLCQNYEDGKFEEFAPFRDEAASLTDAAKKSGQIIGGSVYVRDLETGRWTGLNEEESYDPASLLKVPILIAYYKAAESNPALLNERVYYRHDPGQAPPLVEKPLLNASGYYSVGDLLRGMIIDSDNTAKTLLESRLNKDALMEAYGELGVPSPYDSSGAYRISTKTYALFFRVLYNATFLNRDMSEKALALLAEAKFNKGLRAGIPTEVSIAHKYGYHIVRRDAPSQVELSDCGVVYAGKPYLLCVMVRGGDPETTSGYIKDVASTAYRLLISK